MKIWHANFRNYHVDSYLLRAKYNWVKKNILQLGHVSRSNLLLHTVFDQTKQSHHVKYLCFENLKTSKAGETPASVCLIQKSHFLISVRDVIAIFNKFILTSIETKIWFKRQFQDLTVILQNKLSLECHSDLFLKKTISLMYHLHK